MNTTLKICVIFFTAEFITCSKGATVTGEPTVFLGLTHAHLYLDKVNSTAILKHSQISEDFNYCDKRQQLEEKQHKP